MKKYMLFILFFISLCPIFSLPVGLSNKPLEQMEEYLDKPLPEGFKRVDLDTYMGEEILTDNGVLLLKVLSVENGLVYAVGLIWQSSNGTKLLILCGEILDLLEQYRLGKPIVEGDKRRWTYNNRTILEWLNYTDKTNNYYLMLR